MPFARRKPSSFLRRARNAVWPHMGWGRMFRYYVHKLRRLPESPEAVAGGFGWGIAVSVTPLLGAHTIVSMILARVTGGSMVAAFFATFALNPWTAPPVWLATYYLGKVMAGDSINGGLPGFIGMFRGLTEAALTLNGGLFFEKVWPVFGPMLLGSIPLGALAGLAAYVLLRSTLVRLRTPRVAAA